MTRSVDNAGRPFNRTLFTIVVLIGMFASNINQTILAVAQPTLMQAFHIPASSAQWLSTSYSLIIGVMTPVTAWLADNKSSKTLFEWAMGFFLLGTTLCYFANSFAALLGGRMIQAVGGALLAGIGTTMLYSVYPLGQRGTVSALMGLVFGLAPAIGPTFSGWVIDRFEWHDIFGILLPLLAVAFVLGLYGLRSVVMVNRAKLDWPSVFLSAFGFGSLLYGFAVVGTRGWLDWQVLGGIFCGAVLVAWFIWRQLHISAPILKMTIFKAPTYRIAVVITALSQIAFAGFEFVLPLYLQTVRGLSAMSSGMCLILGALVNAAMSPVTGYVFDHYNAPRMIKAGLLIMLLGTIPFAFVTAQTPVVTVVLLYAIRSLGFSAVQMPITTLGINVLPPALISHGSSGNNMMRYTASAIGTAILISVQQNVANTQAGHVATLADPRALLSGYHVAFTLVAVLLIIALVTALRLSSKDKEARA
ncbi:MDR family MFS transporter [Lacticaseibacillus yichunensis]|uniref:MDR family MFS transporter n=1 Tax=Lacticaseibacillus yichunensis TaxID=2486015 RepID=A0ABW4CSX3_9LACO|nr:MDR family MFS transporter [Lacticaseibacillus yichunensis]